MTWIRHCASRYVHQVYEERVNDVDLLIFPRRIDHVVCDFRLLRKVYSAKFSKALVQAEESAERASDEPEKCCGAEMPIET